MKIFRNIFPMVCMVMFALIFMFPISVEAGSEIKQTNQSQDSVTISWEPLDAGQGTVSNYHVYIGTDYDSACVADKRVDYSADNTTHTFTDLKGGNRYYVRVTCDYIPVKEAVEETTETETETDTTEEKEAEPVYDEQIAYGFIRTNAGTIENLKKKKWYPDVDEVSFTWDKQTGANGYECTLINASGKTVRKWTVRSNIAYCEVSSSQIYKVKVRSYTVISGKKTWGKSAETYLIMQPNCSKKTKVSTGKLSIYWGKIKGASSYDIYVSKKEKSGFVKVKTVSSKTNKLVIKKFKNKKIAKTDKFYIYIVAKKKVGNTTFSSFKKYTYRIKGSKGYRKNSF